MSNPHVHTTPELSSDINVPSANGCSASTTVTSVVTDGAHNFVFEATAHFAGNPHSCPVKLKCKSHGSFFAKLKKWFCPRPQDSTTPDPGSVTVTLSSDPAAPQTVPVDYVP